jgi:hypothetical protein
MDDERPGAEKNKQDQGQRRKHDQDRLVGPALMFLFHGAFYEPAAKKKPRR